MFVLDALSYFHTLSSYRSPPQPSLSQADEEEITWGSDELPIESVSQERVNKGKDIKHNHLRVTLSRQKWILRHLGYVLRVSWAGMRGILAAQQCTGKDLYIFVWCARVNRNKYWQHCVCSCRRAGTNWGTSFFSICLTKAVTIHLITVIRSVSHVLHIPAQIRHSFYLDCHSCSAAQCGRVELCAVWCVWQSLLFTLFELALEMSAPEVHIQQFFAFIKRKKGNPCDTSD